MRCPKCGFISFDHLTSCAKCGRDVSELAVELQGTSIKSEMPMFLSGALGAFSGEEEETFEEQALDTEMEEGIDFDMEMEGEEEVALEEEGADVDFSFEDEGEEEADISLAEAEAEEAAPMEAEAAEDVDLDLGAEEVEISEEEKADVLAAVAEEIEEEEEEAAAGFEELDLSGTADEGEEGGLEFDLEDFIEDDDEEK
jgi:hypothetical protein